MPWGLAIGAGAGLVKNEMIDKPRAHKQRELAAATERYSPWTGMHGQPVQESDPFGNALQFGAAGAGMKSGWEKGDAEKALLMALSTRLGTSPSGTPQQVQQLQMPQLGESSGYGQQKPSWFFGDNPRPFSQPSAYSPAPSGMGS